MDDEGSTYDDSTSNMPSDLYPDMGDEEILAAESTTSSMGDGVEVLLIYSIVCSTTYIHDIMHYSRVYYTSFTIVVYRLCSNTCYYPLLEYKY